MKQGPDFSRFRRAVTRSELPDRVPLGENDIDLGQMERFLGRRIADLSDYVAFWREAGYDYVLLEIRSQYLADSFQRRIAEQVFVHPAARDGATVWTGGSVIADQESFGAYPWTRPEEVYYRDIDEVARRLPEGMQVMLCIGPLYNGIARAMGMEAFLSAYAQDPALMRAVADMFGSSIVRIVANVLERSWVGGVWLGDDFACNTGLMVSPEYLRTYVFPYYRQVGEICRRRGRLFIFHSDGNRDAVLEDLRSCGIHALHPNERAANDFAALKRRWGDRFAFVGNVDVDLLERGRPEDVEEAVRDLMTNVAPGGGFVLGSGNSITERVPLANYRALIDSARRYGSDHGV